MSSFEDKKKHISKFRSRPLKEREYTDSSIDNSIYALDDKDDCCFKFLYFSQKYDPMKACIKDFAPCMFYHIGFTLKKIQLFAFTVNILSYTPDWAVSNISMQHKAKRIKLQQ